MLKLIILCLLMLVKYCESINKNLIYYDYTNEISNQINRLTTIQQLNSECNNIKDEILTSFKLNFNNNICTIDSNTSVESKVKKPSNSLELELFYISFIQVKDLFQEFQYKFNQLKLIEQSFEFKTEYGDNKCKLIDFYKDILVLKERKKTKISKHSNNLKCFLIDYYKSLSNNHSVDIRSKETNLIINKPYVKKFSYLRKYYRKILQDKHDIKIKNKVKKCHLNSYFKKLVLRVIKSIEVSNKLKEFKLKNSCRVNKNELMKNYFKIFKSKKLNVVVKHLNVNKCDLNWHYENIIRNVSYLNLKKNEPNNLFELKKISILKQNKSKLFDHYKNITSSIIFKRVLKIKKIIDLNRSNLLSYYKSLFEMNVVKLNKIKNKKSVFNNSCFLNEYYLKLVVVNITKKQRKLNENKSFDVCSVDDLIHYTFLEPIKRLQKTELIKQVILYDKNVYLFNAKYLKCVKINKTRKRIIKKECKQCISYVNWFIQLAPKNNINKTQEIKCDQVILNSLIQLNEEKLYFNQENSTVDNKKLNETKIIEPAKCEGKFQIDCYDYYKQGYLKNSLLSIRPNLKTDCNKVKVSCDMKSNGFTLVMRRQYGTLDFKRNWTDYKNGFGDPAKDHWIGNDMLYFMTNQLNYSLRIEIEDWKGNRKYANYDTFRVKSEAEGYELQVSGYSGDAGDSFTDHSGQKFSTYDVDNDEAPIWFINGNCAARFGGGWWYKACYKSNLNGKYYTKGIVPPKMNDGIAWKSWLPSNYSFKLVEMKIRRSLNKRL